jgi:hypothetical protein
MTRFNVLLREVQQERPQLRLVDLARWMKRWPDGQFDPTLRPDGVHFDEDASANVIAPWLGPAILRAYSGAVPPPS